MTLLYDSTFRVIIRTTHGPIKSHRPEALAYLSAIFPRGGGRETEIDEYARERSAHRHPVVAEEVSREGGGGGGFAMSDCDYVRMYSSRR